MIFLKLGSLCNSMIKKGGGGVATIDENFLCGNGKQFLSSAFKAIFEKVAEGV